MRTRSRSVRDERRPSTSRQLELVVDVRDEDELERALERLDPEIFLLSAARGRRATTIRSSRCSRCCPTCPAGKLAIADVAVCEPGRGAPAGARGLRRRACSERARPRARRHEPARRLAVIRVSAAPAVVLLVLCCAACSGGGDGRACGRAARTAVVARPARAGAAARASSGASSCRYRPHRRSRRPRRRPRLTTTSTGSSASGTPSSLSTCTCI